ERGGVGFFFEPEYAAAALRKHHGIPAASAAGEQYAVAVLLYWLATGAYYVDFSLEREEMLRQIAEEPPRPFAERGVEPGPQLERVLVRALAKDPGERFPSLAALAEALAPIAPIAQIAQVSEAGEIPDVPDATESPARRRASAASPARALLAAVLAE